MRNVTRIRFVCVPPEGSELSLLRLTVFGAEAAYILREQGYEVYKVTTTWEKLEG